MSKSSSEENKEYTNLPHATSFLSNKKEETTGDIRSLSCLPILLPNAIGSLNHKMKDELQVSTDQNKCKTHLPLAAGAQCHQDRSQGSGGRCLQLLVRGSAGGTASAPPKTSTGEYSVSTMQRKSKTHLPLFTAARFDRYRSGG